MGEGGVFWFDEGERFDVGFDVRLRVLCRSIEQTHMKVRLRVRMRDHKAVNLSAVWQGGEFECCVAGLRI